jgi:hypothetical protein
LDRGHSSGLAIGWAGSPHRSGHRNLPDCYSWHSPGILHMRWSHGCPTWSPTLCHFATHFVQGSRFHLHVVHDSSVLVGRHFARHVVAAVKRETLEIFESNFIAILFKIFNLVISFYNKTKKMLDLINFLKIFYYNRRKTGKDTIRKPTFKKKLCKSDTLYELFLTNLEQTLVFVILERIQILLKPKLCSKI